MLLVVAGDGVFPVLPGETAIVAAAVLAADGTLSLPLVILAGAVGAVIGRLVRVRHRARRRRPDQERGRAASPGPTGSRRPSGW